MQNYDPVSAGKKLRSTRVSRGQTQRQVAADIGVEQSYISMIELGQKTGSLQTLVRLANYLDVSIDGVTKPAQIPFELPDDTPAGLQELLSDGVFVEGLVIDQEDVDAMLTVKPRRPMGKQSYLQLLLMLRGS